MLIFENSNKNESQFLESLFYVNFRSLAVFVAKKFIVFKANEGQDIFIAGVNKLACCVTYVNNVWKTKTVLP